MELAKIFGGRYERGEEIASRSSSSIFRCVDRESKQEFVLKIFSDPAPEDSSYAEEFNSELQKLKALEHPALCRVLDGGLEGRLFYLVLQFVEGETLRELLKREGGPLSEERAIDICNQLAGALSVYSSTGLVHGHLDSRAVLLREGVVKLAGYFPAAITKIRQAQTSADGFIVDPAYISPEQVTGSAQVDLRSDLYSLAVLFYEMLTGKKPFVAGNAFQAAMMRVQEAPPSPSMLRPDLNPMLDAAVVKALSKTQEGRFQSFEAFMDAVRAGAGRGSEAEQTVGVANSGSRLGTETVGVGISTDQIRKMLEERDKVEKSSAAVSKEAAPTEDATAEHSMPKAATVGPKKAERVKSQDGAETVVGSVDIKELPASFMIVSGPRRGSRFMLESGQSVLGSDPTCTVSVNEKGVPARFALIVRKGSDYVLAPFGARGVQVNGETVEAESEHVLIRGDVVEVGPCELRYVAPGEVFTLEDDVADRTVDRPVSKLGTALKIATALTAVVCVLLFFVFQQGISAREAASRKAATSTAAKRKVVIAKLRKEGDELFKEGKLIEPVGSNALTRFEQILEIDPEDTYAKRRLGEIKDRVAALRQQRRNRERQQQKIDQLLIQAQQFFDKGDFMSPPGANAKDTYQAVLRIDPQNEQAQSGLKEIDQRLGSLLDQVNKLLAQAKSQREAGNIVRPDGNNAHQTLKQVLELNPGNVDAKEMLLDMAAESIYRGDRFKRKAKPSEMKQQYLVAQMLGADPEYLAPRMRGAELMKRSSANVIIFDGEKGERNVPKETPQGYLDSSEIERRVAAWKLNDQVSGAGGDERFIELR